MLAQEMLRVLVVPFVMHFDVSIPLRHRMALRDVSHFALHLLLGLVSGCDGV